MWFLGVAPWSLSEDLGTHALDPRVHLHGAGEIAGMEKKKGLKMPWIPTSQRMREWKIPAECQRPTWSR